MWSRILMWFRSRGDSEPAPSEIARQRADKRSKRAKRSRGDPTTLPTPLQGAEVSEGNTHADWDAWEDSMTALDSQMGNLNPTHRVYERERDERFTRPGPLGEQEQEPDVFGKVGKNRDV